MGVEDDDAVIAVRIRRQAEIFLGTRDGMAIRFAETDVRPMGRTAYGVRGISCAKATRSWRWKSCSEGGTC